MNTQEYRKVYVDVYAVMLRNGTVKPRRFQWEDGAYTRSTEYFTSLLLPQRKLVAEASDIP